MAHTPHRRLPSLAVVLLAASGGLALAKASIAPLVAVLEEADDYKQRLAAVIGLGRIGDRRAVPALIDALEDEHPTVRGTAASVLGQLADRRAIPALARLAKDARERYIRDQAQRALDALRALPPTPSSQPTPPSAGGPTEMTVRGTLGTLAQSEVQAGVKALLAQARDCFARRLASASYLGGKLTLRFRVDAEGKVRWLRLERGDLGSLDTERCIVSALRVASFAKPRGGEAEFTIPLAFGGGDPVTPLDESSPLASQLRLRCKALLEGTGADTAPAGLQVSLYVDHRGQVVEAGLACSAELPAAFADRFVANLRRLTLARQQPASGYAKLVYRFACGGS